MNETNLASPDPTGSPAPLGTSETSAARDPVAHALEDRRRRRRRRIANGVVIAVCVALLAGASAIVVGIRHDDSAPERAQDHRARLERREVELADAAREARDNATELVRARGDAMSSLGGLQGALDDAAAAQNALADVHNRATDQYNAGNDAVARETFVGEGTPAIAELEAKVAAGAAAVDAADRAVAALKELL